MRFRDLFKKPEEKRGFDIVNVLQRINFKRKHEDIPLVYGDTIKIAFVLVGRPEIVARYGGKPYAERIRYLAKCDVKRVYVLAKGMRNIDAAKEAVKKTKALYRKVERFPSHPTSTMAICFCLEK